VPSALTRRDVSIRTFVNRLVAHATNAYSVFCIFLAVLGVAWTFYASNLLWLSGAAALFSLIPASYRTWREAVEQLPEVASLAIACNASVINLPIDNRVPHGLGKLDIRLSISNPTDEPVYLTGVSLVSWEAPNELFLQPLSAKLYGKDDKGSFGKMRYPIKFEAKARRDDIAFFAAIRAQTTDQVAFARSLGESREVAVRFRVATENASRVKNFVEVSDGVPTNAYRDMAFATWRRSGDQDLLDAAGASK